MAGAKVASVRMLIDMHVLEAGRR
eukprot:COSAG02_NODE_26666_length_627_cov_39.552342_2_plen_23_part_01